MKEIVKFNASVEKVHQANWQVNAESIIEPLKPIGVESSSSGLVLTFFFDRYPEKIAEARNALKAKGINSSIWVKREYTPTELLTAEFLIFGTDNVVNSVSNTLHWEKESVCPHCNFQETHWNFSQLRIQDTPEGYQIAMVDWHPQVVSTLLAHQMQLANFTGLKLVPLEEISHPSWYAIRAIHTLPSLLSPPTRLWRLPTATANCSRNHHWKNPDSAFYYQRKGFEALDFNATYELFGDSVSSARFMIISKRVYHRFVDLGVKGISCEPIQLVD
jgi:hypothetical protein